MIDRERLLIEIKEWATKEYETPFLKSYKQAIILEHDIQLYQREIKGYDVELELCKDTIKTSIATKEVILRELLASEEKSRYEHENSLHAKMIRGLTKLRNHQKWLN